MQDPLQRSLPSGALADLVTPFRHGAVDKQALANLVKWQIQAGISGIVVLGQAGEATSLSRRERADVIRTAVDAAARHVPVLAGAGTNATAATIDLTRDACECGATAAVIVTPYYSRPTQEGIFHHFAQIAAAVDMPIVVCNVPACTAIDLAPSTLERLASLPAIAGIQDCTGDLARLATSPLGPRSRLKLYSGHDLTAFPFNLAGASGSISVAANVIPRFVGAIHDALRTGNLDTAVKLNARINPILQALERESGPAAVKHALHVLNGLDPEVRLPLTPVTAETASDIRAALAWLSPVERRIAV